MLDVGRLHIRWESRVRPEDIPPPDYDDPKELYAFFGLTFFHAQVLEQGIVNLAVALQARGIGGVTAGEVLELYQGLEGRTFGNVLNAARGLMAIPDSLDHDLEQARRHRNYLAHHFFVDHDCDLLSESGRNGMIDELHSILTFILRVDAECDRVWMTAWGALGLSQAWFDQEFARLRHLAPDATPN